MKRVPNLPAIYIRRITGFLVLFSLALLLLHVAAMLLKYHADPSYWRKVVMLFDLDAEKNIPTYFSCCLLLFSSTLSMLAAGLQIPSKRRPWLILGAGFFVMSLEEFIGLHEFFGKLIKEHMRVSGGSFSFPWIFPALLLVTVLGFVLLRFFLVLPAKTRFLFGLSAFVYLGGALGMEWISGFFYHPVMPPDIVLQSIAYTVASSLEETLEMAGLIIYINTLLEYLAAHTETIQFRILK